MIRDLAEIECVILESKINPAVIREYYIGCDAGFANLWSVIRDSHRQNSVKIERMRCHAIKK